MGEKQDMIKRMMELQKKFIAYELEHGVKAEEYFAAPEGHPLHGYKDEYRDLALKLVDIAHKEKGSHA